jgi:beta-lactamase superfamily II metal-dependent hydrolase
MGICALVYGALRYYQYIETPKVIFLDVGQGDAIVFSKGAHQMIIDSGKDQTATAGLSRYVYPWDRSIEIAVATHPDMDHVGGFEMLINQFVIQKLVITSHGGSTELYQRILDRAAQQGTQIMYAQSGQVITGPFWNARIIWPDKGYVGVDTNDASVSMQVQTRLVDGLGAILLTGDNSTEIEGELVRRYGNELRSDILKLGHHGSQTSTSDEFLSAVHPRLSIVSYGCDNPYGHPHNTVINRVMEYRSAMWSTCTQGDAVISSWKDSKM